MSETPVCFHPEAARRTRVETTHVVIGRCSACEQDVEFEYSRDDDSLREDLDRVKAEYDRILALLDEAAAERDALRAAASQGDERLREAVGDVALRMEGFVGAAMDAPSGVVESWAGTLRAALDQEAGR